MSFISKFKDYAGELGLDVFFIKGIPAILNLLKNAHAELTPEQKKKIPGFLGLSNEDEEIFNQLVAQLDPKDRVVIMSFLKEKCRDYERRRFIFIVAGMEFFPEIKEEITVATEGKKSVTKTKPGSPAVDLRLNFLESFAETVQEVFKGDLDKAYAYCIGGRMIIADPLHQKILKSFSESAKGFKEAVLYPLGVDSIVELTQIVNEKIKTEGTSFSVDLKTYRQEAHARRVAQSQKRRRK